MLLRLWSTHWIGIKYSLVYLRLCVCACVHMCVYPAYYKNTFENSTPQGSIQTAIKSYASRYLPRVLLFLVLHHPESGAVPDTSLSQLSPHAYPPGRLSLQGTGIFIVWLWAFSYPAVAEICNFFYCVPALHCPRFCYILTLPGPQWAVPTWKHMHNVQ